MTSLHLFLASSKLCFYKDEMGRWASFHLSPSQGQCAGGVSRVAILGSGPVGGWEREPR